MDKKEMIQARRMHCPCCNTRLRRIVPFGKTYEDGVSTSFEEIGFIMHCCRCGSLSTHLYQQEEENITTYTEDLMTVITNNYTFLPPICGVPETSCPHRRKCPTTRPKHHRDLRDDSKKREEEYREETAYPQKKYL